MCHNMSIYRRLNPRLLVQVGLGLGLLHWANMSNIYLYHPPSNSRQKLDEGLRLDKHEKITWRCREECLWRNHNEECANWPILEFQMKKRSLKLESTQKTKQDRSFRKFWLLVKGQCKKSKSTGPGSKSTDTWSGSVLGFRVGHGSSCKDADSSWWRGADVD